MRAAKLAAAALQAEKLRLHALAHRQMRRSAWALAGVAFLLGALGFAHVAAGLALAAHLGLVRTSLILLAFDLAVGLALLFIALRSRPGAIEIEAQALKRRALSQLKQETWLSALRAGAGFAKTGGPLLLAEVVARLSRRKSA